MLQNSFKKPVRQPWRIRLFEVIFEADTPAGRWFDVALILTILLSVAVVFLDSVRSIRAVYGRILTVAEWIFTILFTVEYILRNICVEKRIHYITSFYGIVDLLGVIPTYLSLVFPGTRFLSVIRILRVQRIFRILNLSPYLSELRAILQALKASRRKIMVFLVLVLIIAVVVGSLMYVIEGESNGFNSIPHSLYWAIVTMTTVGYGDISPQTPLGQLLAAVLMIMGYSIIVVPTGIVSVEMIRNPGSGTQACPRCSAEGHDDDAVFCKYCGGKL